MAGDQPNSKRVLSVGQCLPDHSTLCRFIERHFHAYVAGADAPSDALEQLRSQRFALVLINRQLDADYSDGIEVLRQIKADPQLAGVPVMVISNHAEAQADAIAAGAEPGFGKLQYEDPDTLEKLGRFLSRRP